MVLHKKNNIWVVTGMVSPCLKYPINDTNVEYDGIKMYKMMITSHE